MTPAGALHILEDGYAYAPARVVEAVDVLREALQRLADLSGETAFVAQRVAWHLGNGCDSPEKARELALKEWRVGVLGEVVP